MVWLPVLDFVSGLGVPVFHSADQDGAAVAAGGAAQVQVKMRAGWWMQAVLMSVLIACPRR